MKKYSAVVVACICIWLSGTHKSLAWGVWGHNHINTGAVYALPPAMGTFFYNHLDFIVQESTVPDLRKYTYKDSSENCRHYINLEMYGYGNGKMPATVQEAVAKYGKDSVMRYGILPWHIQHMTDMLTEAFKKRRKTEILLIAADLGHYVADAHVPLHTTYNHDGQLSGQRGIHAFWESQLPELFGSDYKLYTGDALYLKNTDKAAWEIVESSFAKTDDVFALEKRLRIDKPIDKQYVIGPDGKPVKNKFGQAVHTYEYAHIYHELLNGMVEQQVRLAIQYTADLWYTAWVNAGRPNLRSLDKESLTDYNKEDYRYFRYVWKTKGKIIGCDPEREFPDLRKH